MLFHCHLSRSVNLQFSIVKYAGCTCPDIAGAKSASKLSWLLHHHPMGWNGRIKWYGHYSLLFIISSFARRCPNPAVPLQNQLFCSGNPKQTGTVLWLDSLCGTAQFLYASGKAAIFWTTEGNWCNHGEDMETLHTCSRGQEQRPPEMGAAVHTVTPLLPPLLIAHKEMIFLG